MAQPTHSVDMRFVLGLDLVSLEQFFVDGLDKLGILFEQVLLEDRS